MPNTIPPDDPNYSTQDLIDELNRRHNSGLPTRLPPLASMPEWMIAVMLGAQIRELRRGMRPPAEYEALGRACEANGLAEFADDGSLRFAPPADIIAEDARISTLAELRRAPADEEIRKLLTAGQLAGGHPSDDEPDGWDAEVGREFIRLRHKIAAALAEPRP